MQDVTGVARLLDQSEFLIIFYKISYLVLQQLINNHSTQFIGSKDFIVCLLGFYEVMRSTSIDKLVQNSQTVFYSILMDCFKLISTLRRLILTSIQRVDQRHLTAVVCLRQFSSKRHKML